ncbi:MAG: hypothetical protein AAGA81_13970 [Acidobacteriota bacterium]
MKTAPALGQETAAVSRHWLVCALAILALALVGCDDDDDPTGPDAETFVLSSLLTRESSVVHEISFPTNGTLRMTLEELRPVLLDTTDLSVDNLLVRFELARRLNGECGTSTAQLTFQVDQTFLIDIATTDYCLTISDPGILPNGTTIEYSLVIRLE